MNPARILRRIASALTVVVGLLASAGSLAGQAGADALASQSLRPYWYVFIAYAAVWLVVMAWIVSIARRMGKLESKIAD